MQAFRQVSFFLFCFVFFVACPPAPSSSTALGKEDSIAPRENTALPDSLAPALGVHISQQLRPTNIILMIGDGMGLTQISAAMFSNSNQLALERFPVVGLHKPYASDNLIADSAAGATAFSCGIKTYNGAIGVGPDTQAVRTILEAAEAKNMATGLLTTCSITHATPASFVAHNEYRKNMEAIALDFMKVDLDLLIGGGQKYFDRREQDERNLLKEMRQRGYQVTSFVDEDIEEVNFNTKRNIAYFTAASEPLPFLQGRDYLLPATSKALGYLDKKAAGRGFFFMIESAQIDWGGHANNSEYIISEALEFDKAIAKVLDFAAADGNTLVIVTADHETGGYAINYGSKMDSIVPAFTSDYHTGTMIPVFAFGPGAAEFGGIYENTAIFDKMMRLLGL